MKNKYFSTKLACYIAYIVQAVVNNFLCILFIAFQDVYSLGYEKLARLFIFNFAVQMIADFSTPKIVAKLGYRKTAVLCQFMAAAGLIMLSVLPGIMDNTYLAIIISIIFYAFGSGLMEVIISPLIEMLPTKNKSGNMAFLHSFYCWGQAFTVVVTTLLVGSLGYANWALIPLIWAIIPLLNMFSFLKVPLVVPDKEVKEESFKILFRDKRFRIYMVMMLCAGASEIAMAQWASMFAQQALGVSKVIGDLAGPCAFALCMATGRVFQSAVSQKIQFEKLLIVLSSLCAVCYLVVAFSNIPALSLVFCAVCGFTVSISWPGIYSAGAKTFPKGSATMFSVFAICGDTGCCLGPWLLGIVAEAANLNIGFAVSALFPVVMIIATLLLVKNKDCKSAA